ncbi:hypothetical protein ACO0M4_32610 [Streptomyces sp. RGM 3693]|uniref:hypothetical protein n=1 Tax=Streptomyces sp. RGM 3693 TaxID=3413284 RepID=UPI003D266090
MALKRSLFVAWGISLNIGSVLLMAPGAQWRTLFHVIVGASAIPSHLRGAMTGFQVGCQRLDRLAGTPYAMRRRHGRATHRPVNLIEVLLLRDRRPAGPREGLLARRRARSPGDR